MAAQIFEKFSQNAVALLLLNFLMTLLAWLKLWITSFSQ